MKSILLAGAGALALSSAARADEATISEVVVTASSPAVDLAAAPATSASIDAETIGRTVNLTTPEDALRYLPNVTIRQRHIGDTQSPITTRTSGVGASARSLIYVDGMLISALIGNNNTSASPKWGLIAPEAIERVEVLYGPFSAAFAGNSIGSVVSITTRMPTGFEASAEAQGALQAFAKYGDEATFGTARLSAGLGDRRGRLAFRLSYNHLDSRAQPLTYATAAVAGATGAAGTPVTGAFSDTNRSGQPIVVLGSTAIEHQVQDNLSGRLTYEVSPGLAAAYSFGLFRNGDDAAVASYLRDASGAPVYTGQVDIAGRTYSLASNVFSSGVYRLDELQLAQGLSLASHTGGAFDFELVGTAFDYLQSRQRAPSGALPAAFAGGPGSATDLRGTGWETFDARGLWRAGGHAVSFGAHQDGFRLDSPRYALASWTDGPAGALQAANRGRTETRALWGQDAWTLSPRLKATLGLRYERWRGFDGLNASVSPPLDVAQPTVRAAALSPKAVLAYALADGWTVKASAGLAARFPTVSELYQSVTVGTQLQTPDPFLRPERARSGELGLEHMDARSDVRLSVFGESVTDALLSQTAPLPSGAAASFVQNVGRTRAVGVELVVERRDALVGGLTLSGWLTYVDGRTEEDAALPAAVGKRLPQLPPWRGAATAVYSATPKLDLSVSARYSDRAFATIDNSDSRADTYQGFSAWFVVDARARYRLSPHLTASLGIDNLNDRAYVLFHPFPGRTVTADLRYAY